MLAQRLRPSLLNSSRLPLRSVPRRIHTTSPLLLRIPRNITALSTPCRPGTIPRAHKFTAVTPAGAHSRTLASGTPLKKRSRLFQALYRTFAIFGFATLTVGGLVVALFVYDATTYKDEAEKYDIGVSEIALNPRTGGPKNLPIAEVLVDAEDLGNLKQAAGKPRLVILGTGWGSVALLKNINPDEYDITVIGPSNYFLYTPLLPSATVGTVEVRSLIEPIRGIVRDAKGHFLKASAVDVEFSEKLVEVSQTMPNGEVRNFYVPYDKLVIGVGSKTRTHGVKGLEHVHYLKDVTDARRIRAKVIENFERACLPTTSDEERRKLLSFAVCGGGPTGVEFAAELFDMLNEDLVHRYPKILRNEVSVHLLQSRSHILNTYDEALSKYAEERFARDGIDLLTNSRVVAIEPDRVIFTQQDEKTKEIITKELPFGMCLWSTGVAQTDFSQHLAAKLEAQHNKRALETDTYLRLLGTPLGDVYAIGDCSTVQNKTAPLISDFLKQIAWERGIKDPKQLHLTFSDWRLVATRIRKRFPQTTDHLKRLDKLFESYDEDRSGTLDFQELNTLLCEIDSKLTSLPATAQRAHQQGVYLARKFNKIAHAAPGLKMNQVVDGDLDAAVYKAFKYSHMGSLAYIGNAAVFDLNGYSLGGGLIFLYLWRSVYFAQSVSFRTRLMLAMDWTKRAMFGRDLVNF
ncbi:FAD/NAD(P)-binding domain-containing protein [Ascodesmis nigricans]|uniref:FAD/NAD(P)-binding domain-containing protein n=1 Tax=Ascodesmis nigricans TaxID=341454 RepID=A0A4S2N4C6_9PEZI|nr:FAD/NAD(P)-binding domain-containing protein [Ascodesmis nigricans]